jgi:alanine racemase
VSRPTVAFVDLENLAHNARAIRAHLAALRGPSAPSLIGVVKADAYGHGAVPAARTLVDAGAATLACADIDEGLALRAAGIEAPILVFGALSLGDLDGLVEGRLTPTVSTPTAAHRLQDAAARRGAQLAYHLGIDTGMLRLGLRHDNLARTLPAILAAPNLRLEGVYTHFATADVPGDELFARQCRTFEAAERTLAALGGRGYVRHAANSGALLADPATWLDAVRPGILMYGAAPGAFEGRIDVRPVMSVRSRVVAVKGVRVGETIGYGGRFVARRPTTMAVVPAGYADGMDRRLEGRGWVLLRGRRVPVAGAVSMDMLALDVTGTGVETGDEVVFTGRQGDEEITVSEMADWVGTIPYELLCRFGNRVERMYCRP